MLFQRKNEGVIFSPLGVDCGFSLEGATVVQKEPEKPEFSVRMTVTFNGSEKKANLKIVGFQMLARKLAVTTKVMVQEVEENTTL